MKNFLKKNVYYFILIGCIVAVCIGGNNVLEKRAADNTELPEQLSNINSTSTASATLKPSSADYTEETAMPTVKPTATATAVPTAIITEVPTAAPTATPEATAVPSYSEDGDQEGSTEVNKPVEKEEEEIVFSCPVESLNIITEFADDKLVYNKTLKEWRIHPAIDLAATAGSNVTCVYDGKVSEILSDPLYGTTVVIDHGNDLQTVYCGINVSSGISAGTEVKKGDTIGTVTESGVFCERELESHIHFEVVLSGKKANPINYFEK